MSFSTVAKLGPRRFATVTSWCHQHNSLIALVRTTLLEERAQQLGRLVREYAVRERCLVQESRVTQDVVARADGAGLLVERTDHDASNSRVEERPGAHDARLQRDVGRDVIHAPRRSRERRVT